MLWVHRHLMQPVAALVAQRQIEAGAQVIADLAEDGDELVIGLDQEPPRRLRRYPLVG